MKIIKRVKLARIPYEEMRESDIITTEALIAEGRKMPKKWTKWSHEEGLIVLAYDTTKYPPESVTWDVVGIDGKRAREDIEYILVYWGDLFAEGNYETIYE